MPVIDIHAHIFPDELAAVAIPALEEEGGIRATYDGTLSGLLAEMDRAGIDVAVIQPVSTKPTQVSGINDWAASIASDRIVPFGSMYPDLKAPAEEIVRMRGLGLRGFKMHPEYQRFSPDEDRMARVYEAARDNEMTILFHSGHDIAFPTALGTPEVFARVLDAWPGLRLILAHLGGWQLWDDVRRYLVGRDDVWFDTAYTLGHMPDAEYLALVRDIGPERVLFGTDGPWTDMTAEIERTRGLGLTTEELERILGGNAAELLGIGGRPPR